MKSNSICIHSVGESLGRVTAMSAYKRRIIQPTTLSQLHLMETSESKMEENGGHSSDEGKAYDDETYGSER